MVFVPVFQTIFGTIPEREVFLTGIRIEGRPEPRQQHHLTVESRQGISLLSLSALELNEHVANCLEENVFLERDERDLRKHPLEAETIAVNVRTEALLDRMQKNHSGVTGGSYGEIRREFPFEKYMTEQQTLESYLKNALAQELRGEEDLAIGEYLIGNIDAAGYLRVDVNEAADRFKVSVGRVERVLAAVQGCAPAGVGARTVEECLLLQLEAAGQAGTLARHLLHDHLPALAAGRITQAAAALAVSPDEVQRVLDSIRRLNPYPGLQFSSDQRQVVCPEAVVEHDGMAYSVRLQEFDLPCLKLNEDYLKMLNEPRLDRETARYLSGQLRTAQGLMTGVEQRRLTIFQVASCIVACQQEFFEKGAEYLKPLTMAQVAVQTGVAESTVSRVVNGKYIQTPQGMVEMRFFFHSRLGSATRETVSSQRVKSLIQNLVAAEDPAHPLSDQAIQNRLAAEGIEISRRTINKYRQNLNIPSRVQRKRYENTGSVAE
jgi:RNA polymerase sigma-54 factor